MNNSVETVQSHKVFVRMCTVRGGYDGTVV